VYNIGDFSLYDNYINSTIYSIRTDLLERYIV
jgi:hypothetical protein